MSTDMSVFRRFWQFLSAVKACLISLGARLSASQSDGLWIAAIASELHAQDHAVDTPKIKFSAKKILAEGFFDNPSNDILDHHGKRQFIQLRFAESGCFNSG